MEFNDIGKHCEFKECNIQGIFIYFLKIFYHLNAIFVINHFV